VPHRRRALLGGVHPVVSAVLTRGEVQTVPVLSVDGRGIGDSTAIIAELERRFPSPPLYPADPAERRRALELEEFFDEECGPYIRRLAYHELTSDPVALAELTRMQVPRAPAALTDAVAPGVTTYLDARFGIRSAERAREAEEKLMAALDRLESGLGDGTYLVGDTFTVADLTAAALLYGLVLPPGGPWHPEHVPLSWEARAEELGDRPALRWISEMYTRHR
jgi:glutathione S-transferase